MGFSTRLTTLRKASNKLQADVAKEIGIARATYGAYEQGIRQPDFDTLEKIADYFSVSTDYLLGRSNHPQLTAEKEKEVDAEVEELMKILEAMPEEEQQEMKARILAYAQGLADAKKNK